jgi:hypothetical protein
LTDTKLTIDGTEDTISGIERARLTAARATT